MGPRFRGDDSQFKLAEICAYANRPWQCLYFLPEPHGQTSLRPTLPQLDGSFGIALDRARGAVAIAGKGGRERRIGERHVVLAGHRVNVVGFHVGKLLLLAAAAP